METVSTQIGYPQQYRINDVASLKLYNPNDVQKIGGSYFLKPGIQPLKPGVTRIPKPGTPIDATKLGQTDTLNKILGSIGKDNTINSNIGGLLSLYNQTTEGQKKYDETVNQLTALSSTLGNQGADLQTELGKRGVPDAYKRVQELNLTAAQLQGKIGAFDAETEQINADIGNQPIPTGLIQGQQAQLKQQRDLTKNSMAAELSATVALSQAYQGNATLGEQLARDAIQMKYAPIENQIATLKTQLEFMGESLSREDANRKTIIGELLNLKEKEIADAKDNANRIQSLAIDLASRGAPLSLVNSVRNATDPVTAARLASQFSPVGTVRSGGTTIKKGGSTSVPKDASGKSIFTQTQLNKGTANAGLKLEEFAKLDDDTKNYFVNAYGSVKPIIDGVLNGTEDAVAVAEEIRNSTLPDGVKQVLLQRISSKLPTTGSNVDYNFFQPVQQFKEGAKAVIGGAWKGIKKLFGL